LEHHSTIETQALRVPQLLTRENCILGFIFHKHRLSILRILFISTATMMPAPNSSDGGAAPAKAAHINMMVDTIISSLPEEGLRAVMRSILVSNQSFTKEFENQSLQWLRKSNPSNMPQLFQSSKGAAKDTISSAFGGTMARIRAMIGCGLGFECLELQQQIVIQASELEFEEESEEGEFLMGILAHVDGQIVQAVTSAGKELLVGKTKRCMTDKEMAIRQSMLDTLEMAQRKSEAAGMEFMFERGLSVMELENF
jgi:hypothetical protein